MDKQQQHEAMQAMERRRADKAAAQKWISANWHDPRLQALFDDMRRGESVNVLEELLAEVFIEGVEHAERTAHDEESERIEARLWDEAGPDAVAEFKKGVCRG